ncbi:MAG: PEP-CTERM sorting domain-containing protein [Myxococcota bacterium]
MQSRGPVGSDPDLALSESTYDLTVLDSLSGLDLPDGWTHRSRVLTEEFVLDSEGLAAVFAQGNVATYQHYTPVPEPGSLLLVSFGFGLLSAGRWNSKHRFSA